MNDPKYRTLVKILDSIRREAPNTPEFRRFHSRKPEDIDFARGQAFIHLFLFVKFGIETFDERHQLVSDGQSDGGLDAYFISELQKTVYLIQSKFKTTGTSFASESIAASDLVRMELDRILGGETKDSNGVLYNPKILEFQLNFSQATRKQVYKQKVVFLANLKNYNDFQVRKLTTNLDYEVYDFETTYLQLVKPVCSGTYYDPDKIVIELDISEKSAPQLSQTITTSYGNCDVMAVFVPTGEIGTVMSRYKNAILRYNPRNYLGLSKNPVNKEIRKSISSITYNDFALLNNGITILADEQEFTIYTGKKNVGRLTLTNPQIINGGQTAYTLSEIYETDYRSDPTVFDGKEVLVRVVVLKQQTSDSSDNRHLFIDSISMSTNQQTQVKEADRHSSKPLLVDMQKMIFLKYGYFLELKSGEFYNGLKRGFVDKSFVVDRTILLRSFIAFSGHPTPARRHSEPRLYEPTFFNTIFTNLAVSNLPQLVSEIVYAYSVHSYLVSLDKEMRKKSLQFGYALRYGKYAVVYASALSMDSDFRNDLHSRSLAEIKKYVDYSIPEILNRWKIFEDAIQIKDANKSYFDPSHNLTDFDTYYKSTTLKGDIESFFLRTDNH